MARPRSEGLQYFPLDCRFDEKINALIMLHGNDGLAFIIRAWQEAYQNDMGVYDISSIRFDIGAKTLRLSTDNFREILNTCLNLQILHEIDPVGCMKYTSNGIQKRIKRVIGEREYDRIYAKNKLSERKPTDNTPIMPQMEMEMEIKRKEKKKEIIPPSIEDVKNYCVERKNTVDPEKWFAYYESNGWRIGKNPMKSWRAAIRTWEKNQYGNGRYGTTEQPNTSGNGNGTGRQDGAREKPGEFPEFITLDGVRSA
jgi:hypothetical protein